MTIMSAIIRKTRGFIRDGYGRDLSVPPFY